MTERTVTTTFDHLSDAHAARDVLESSVRGVRVALDLAGTPANDDAATGIAASQDDQTWELTAAVPAEMEETTVTLLHATTGRDISTTT